MEFGLRASVSNICNMNCCYCPRGTSMEDYSPFGLKNSGLKTEDYVKVLTTLTSAVNFSSVSLTGGEPLLNCDLFAIASAVRPHVQRLELNTNGLLLDPTKYDLMKNQFDRVKISLDCVDDKLFNTITGINHVNALHKVKNAILLVRDSGVDVAVNCVVMKSTIGGLDELISWTQRQGVRLHLLDFYYSDERIEIWGREFYPLEKLIPDLTKLLGEPEQEDIFGCKFLSFHPKQGSGVVRLKTSFSGTMRADKCLSCISYCQEGLYAFKLSLKGWVTTCPSIRQQDGVLLSPDMAKEQVEHTVRGLVADLCGAKRTMDSFSVFVSRNRLSMPQP
jgi:molybdenum cofactor biosynthesis enzyme MoaA